MKIYIVVGYTGEFSDRTEWNVAAYTSRDKAEAHAKGATQYLVPANGAFGMPSAKFGVKASYNQRDHLQSVWDPNCRMNYTGTDYYVNEVELREEVPEGPKFVELIDDSEAL